MFLILGFLNTTAGDEDCRSPSLLDDAPVAQKKNVGDNVLVKDFSETILFRYFVACIIDEQDEADDYEVKFMKTL